MSLKCILEGIMKMKYCQCLDALSTALQWRHNESDGVSYHQRLQCLLNSWFRRRSKKTSKLRVTGFCPGNSPVTGEFPDLRASIAENVSIWWRHDENTENSELTWSQLCHHFVASIFYIYKNEFGSCRYNKVGIIITRFSESAWI